MNREELEEKVIIAAEKYIDGRFDSIRNHRRLEKAVVELRDYIKESDALEANHKEG